MMYQVVTAHNEEQRMDQLVDPLLYESRPVRCAVQRPLVNVPNTKLVAKLNHPGFCLIGRRPVG